MNMTQQHESDRTEQKFWIGTLTWRKNRGRGVFEATGGKQYPSLPKWPLLVSPRNAYVWQKGRKTTRDIEGNFIQKQKQMGSLQPLLSIFLFAHY